MLLLAARGQAQQNKFITDHPVHHGSRNTHRSTVADLAEDEYDVKYLKFNLNVTNTSTALSGDVAATAIVTAPSMSSYVFELDTAYIIDSAKINGTLYAVGGTDSIRYISLSTPLISGTVFTAQVFYHGAVVSSGISSIGGLFNLLDPAWGANTLFTVSEPYHANRWWPCKQSLEDKIDSVDMWITVPDSLKAGSNGILQAVTPIDATHDRYEWKERHPIDYYLISIAVGPYVDYSYYMHFTGSTDSMLVQNYVYSNPAFLPAYKSVLDSVGLMIDYFSGLFGVYPFKDEKYGHSIVYWGGGEENQTMTTLGSPAIDVGTMAHELSHEWFGDNVTCGSWRDIMMNEGFASYISYMYYDHFYDHAFALSNIVYYQQLTKSYDTGSVYVDDTTSEERILDGRLSYAKPAAVLHTLRFVVNDDSDYFHIFRNYQQAKGGGNGTIEDFKSTAQTLLGPVVNGINLDTFFNQWLYLQGFPKYSLSWNQIGADVYVQLMQTTSDPASVPLFKVPLELRLHSLSGDTVVRVLNDQSLQNFHFTYSKTLINVFMDPNCWLIYNVLHDVHDNTLGLQEQTGEKEILKPNPTSDSWQLLYAPENSTFTLTDMSGIILWQSSNGNMRSVVIPGEHLPQGNYVLNVMAPGNVQSSYKLVKQ